MVARMAVMWDLWKACWRVAQMVSSMVESTDSMMAVTRADHSELNSVVLTVDSKALHLVQSTAVVMVVPMGLT